MFEQSKETKMQEFLDVNVPILLMFPSNGKLDGNSFSMCKVMIESMLNTYDLVLMVRKDVPRHYVDEIW
eukprot:c35296_g1_i1 orf=3-206(-)